MPNVKSIQADTTCSSQVHSSLETSRRNGHVHVVVTIDGMTRSSISTIKKDMSEAVKRDLKILKQFGLVT